MGAPQFSFETWVRWVFDHPVAAKGKEEWWFIVPDSDLGGRWLDRPPWRAIRYMTRLFEDPVPPLKPYSDEQIDQGLWFIFNTGNSKHIDWLVSAEVSLAHRRRCIRAIVPLYRKLILPRSLEVSQNSRDPAGQASQQYRLYAVGFGLSRWPTAMGRGQMAAAPQTRAGGPP